MADVDYKSGLPVRSEKDGADERMQCKVVGAAASATLAAAAEYQQKVDGDGNAHVELHGNKVGGSTDQTVILTGNGGVMVDGIYDGSNNPDPSQVGLVGMVRNDTPAESQQTLRLTAKANTDGTVGDTRSLDVALHDGAGNLFSASNPVPVFIAENEPGVETHDEKTEPSAAKDTPISRLFVVPTGSTFYLHQVLCAASGKARFEVLIGDGAVSEVFTKKAVRFNSTSFPNPDVDFAKPIIVVGSATGTNIKVIVENKDNGVQDISTTIVGIMTTP